MKLDGHAYKEYKCYDIKRNFLFRNFWNCISKDNNYTSSVIAILTINFVSFQNLASLAKRNLNKSAKELLSNYLTNQLGIYDRSILPLEKIA